MKARLTKWREHESKKIAEVPSLVHSENIG